MAQVTVCDIDGCGNPVRPIRLSFGPISVFVEVPQFDVCEQCWEKAMRQYLGDQPLNKEGADLLYEAGVENSRLRTEIENLKARVLDDESIKSKAKSWDVVHGTLLGLGFMSNCHGSLVSQAVVFIRDLAEKKGL